MKIYRFAMVLALTLLCLCSWTSVSAQRSGSAASVSRSRDEKHKSIVEELQELRDFPEERDSCELLEDVDVKKNYTIAELADSLFQMAGLARSGNYAQAQAVLDASVASAYRRYPKMEDEDVRSIIDIVEGYRRDLRVYNKYSPRQNRRTCK